MNNGSSASHPDSLSNEKLFKVFDLVSRSPRLSQRELATTTGFSLGLINLIIKRLIQTGYLKISNLNSRKVEYLLTPKGATEKARRTYTYVSKTIRTFMEYQKRSQRLLEGLIRNGRKQFAIMGESDIVPLIEMAIRSRRHPVPYRILKDSETPLASETLLDCRLNGQNGPFGVSILSHLLGSEEEWMSKENRSL